jgi:hypothetical protein
MCNIRNANMQNYSKQLSQPNLKTQSLCRLYYYVRISTKYNNAKVKPSKCKKKT